MAGTWRWLAGCLFCVAELGAQPRSTSPAAVPAHVCSRSWLARSHELRKYWCYTIVIYRVAIALHCVTISAVTDFDRGRSASPVWLRWWEPGALGRFVQDFIVGTIPSRRVYALMKLFEEDSSCPQPKLFEILRSLC